MKLLNRLREEFSPINHEFDSQLIKEQGERVSEYAQDAIVLMEQIEQRKSLNEVA